MTKDFRTDVEFNNKVTVTGNLTASVGNTYLASNASVGGIPIATTTGSQTLTNKTIAAGSNTISGLTNSNLSGTAGITNANLANSSITIGSTAVALGGTATTVSGLTLSSPSFTGTPISTTATVDTNTTQIATTAFVLAQAASANPLMNNSVAVGTSTRFARQDHVHPVDTSRQPLDADLTAIAAITTTGILKRTAADTWTTITDNSTNWDTAYTDRNKWDGGSTGLTAATGRTSLGATTVGSNIFTLTNPSAVTYPRIAADNTVSAAGAATIKTDLSLNNVENTALSTWAGTANITTLGTVATGTWNATTIGTTKGGTGLTSFTANGAVYATSTSALTTGTLPVTSGGTGVTVSTGTGSVVLNTSPTFTGTVNLGSSTATGSVQYATNAGNSSTTSQTNFTTLTISNAAVATQSYVTGTSWTNSGATVGTATNAGNSSTVGGKSVGTSGNVIPVLDTTNTWSADQNFNGNLTINNGSPTIYLQDTDENSAMVHVNSNIFYILRGGNNSKSWSQVNGVWPLMINLTNNDATFGGNLSVGNGLGVTGNGWFTGGIGVGLNYSNPSGGDIYIDSAANTIGLFAIKNSSSYTGDLIQLRYSRAVTSVVDFITAFSAGTTDLEFRVRGDGVVQGDGAYVTPTADYAEYFEWADGNENEENRIGYPVVMVSNGKIRVATTTDDPELIIGIVSAQPAVVADAAWSRWNGKYLTNDIGENITGSFQWWRWKIEEIDPETGKTVEKDIQYTDSNIKDSVVIPEDAETGFDYGRITNPDYDPTVEYESREYRKEWSPIGMVGKLRIWKGQPVHPRWLKMKDISDNVEEWLVR